MMTNSLVADGAGPVDRSRLSGVDHYILFDTAIGRCGLAWNERGLRRILLPASEARKTERRLAVSARPCADAPPPWVAKLIADLQSYFTGKAVDFGSVVLDLTVEPFCRKVYEAAREVGWGQTTTYGELARRAGSSAPEAARDVGQAMARNPVPIVIPCHRVLAAGNAIGGFSAPGGTATKERLLALEGVSLDGGQLALPGIFPAASPRRS